MSKYKMSRNNKRTLVLSETYDILDQIGSGGFSKIYRVRNQRGTTYAVKVITSSGRGIPCIMEPSVMMSYQHPCLNPAVLVEVKGDMLYIFQDEAICNLYEWRKSSKYESRYIKHITRCILQGIAFLHREGVIHGDIKSSNILVFPNQIFKLTDFNLSSRIGWKSKQDICSANMRPLEGWLHEWDETVDVWALGCTLYYLWYGEHLFHAQENDMYRRTRYLFALLDWRDTTIDFEDNIYKPEIHKYMFNVPRNLDYRKPHVIRSILYSDNTYLRIIRDMLRMDPELRPTISELLKNDIFNNEIPLGNIRRLYELPIRDKSNTPPLVEIEDPKYNVVISPNTDGIMYKYSSSEDVASLSQRIYNRYLPFKTDEYDAHTVCVTILWIARKLIHYVDKTYKLPDCANGLSFSKICEIERDIFRKLEAMLH